MWCIYFLLCAARPICIPVPEAAVILWGTGHFGSLGAFFLGVTGSVLGLAVMHTLSSRIARCIFKNKKESTRLIWLQQLTEQHHFWILGALLIIPLVSDEALCAGCALLKISLPQFLKIGIIAKIISVGMIAFSGCLGDLCGLQHWQVIAAELLLMFPASVGLQHFCRQKGHEKYHEGIYIDR